MASSGGCRQVAARIKVKTGRCTFEARKEAPLRPTNYKGRLYFCVNRGRLKLEAFGSTPNEHIAIAIRDSTGKVVFEGDSLEKNQLVIPVDIPIAREQEGHIWSIQFSKVTWRKFEDMGLFIKAGASPVVALSPSQLVFPLFSRESRLLENGNAFFGVAVSPYLKGVKGYSTSFSFAEAETLEHPAKIQFDVDENWSSTVLCSGEDNERRFELRPTVEDDSWLLVGIEYPKEILLCGKASFTVHNSEGNTVADYHWNIAACGGKAFDEIPLKKPAITAEPTKEDITRGYQLFRCEEPGSIRLDCRPSPEELCSEITDETSPGLVACEFFAFLPLRSFDRPHIQIGKLKGPSEIPDEAVKLLTVRMWPQQLGRQGTFAIVPELMLPQDFPFWKERVPYQYCIRVIVPRKCQSGDYETPILLNGVPCATYKLHVDDFNLPEYNDMTFRLYADGQRWLKQNFMDEEILREMRNFREHGINALMLYPLSGSVITWQNGMFQVDLSRFRHVMQLYCQVGFPGVAVFSLQGLDSRISSVLDRKVTMLQPEFEAGLKAVLNTLVSLGKNDAWPEYCIHVIDEPTLKRGSKEAAAVLKIVKQAGFKTFNTCYAEVVRAHLAPWLDNRCYNNSGFHSSPTKEANDILRHETLADGDTFWWYGAGCYAPESGSLDCNIFRNRHMLGLFAWRSGASGAWAWTFLSTVGNPYNDFDGKEDCICYPASDGHDVIDTLQWEGIREGIYDYRYIRFWSELCDQMSSNQEKAVEVFQSRKHIQKEMKASPWIPQDGLVSNALFQRLRKSLIQEIKRLRTF